MNQQQLEQKAKALLKAFSNRHGWVDGLWPSQYKALNDFKKELAGASWMQGEGEGLREQLDTELRGATNDIDLIRIRLAQGSSKDYLDIKLYELSIRLFKCLDKLSKPQTEQP